MRLLIVLISQLLWIASLSGLGSIVLGRIQQQKHVFISPHQVIFISGIMGYLILTVTGLVLNFFFPLNWHISTMLCLVGIFFFAMNHSVLVSGFTRSDFVLIASTALGVWLMSLPGVTDNDTATYHLQVIRWAKESTPPLGLANLHGRLGYNSAWFIAGALIELPFGAKSPFVLNPVMLFFYAGMVIIHYGKKRSALSFSDRFLLLTIVPAAWTFVNNAVAATANDLPVMLLTFLVFYLIARQMESGKKDLASMTIILALAAFALTIKFSSLILFLAAIIYVFSGSAWPFAKAETGGSIRTYSLVLNLALLILTPWAAHGVATSGCVAFPVHAGCFYKLPWAVPEVFVKYEEDFVKAFARDPTLLPTTTDSVLAGWSWMTGWLRRWFLSIEIIKIAPLLLIGATALYFRLRNGKQVAAGSGSRAFITLFSLIGALFWFFSAPDFRFGAGYLYTLFISFLLANVNCISNCTKTRRAFTSLIVLLLIIAGINFTRLAMVGSRFAAIPGADLSRVVTIDGVQVYYPPTGDCWDAPLPCTTFLDKGLRIRTGVDGRPNMFWFEKNNKSSTD